MNALVLAPATGPTPGRMKQPTKDALRQWLVLAVERNEQLQGEIFFLRQAGLLVPTEQAQLVADLVDAATALGHHEALRSSSDETIDYWRTRVKQLCAGLVAGIDQ